MSIQSNFPAIKPTLLLDFANTEELDPRITFTRASTATYYGTQTAKAEENLLLQSQTFDNASWSVAENVSITANTATAPDGTVTADTLAETAVTGIHTCSQNSPSTGVLTLSVFAKLNSGTPFLTIGISTSGTSHSSATFDLSLGTSTQTQVNGGFYSSPSATITAVAQGFYRCTFTVTTTDTAVLFRIGLNNTGTPTTANRSFGANYLGVVTNSIFIWGAQLEQRSAATAYTATTTQPVTNYIPQLLTDASGVARFDHTPTTFESLGLLIEELRSNLILQSETFSTTWAATRSSIGINTFIAPSGAQTADTLIDTTDNDTHFISQSVMTTAVAMTYSLYAKAAGRNFVYLSINDSGNVARTTFFNLSTGAVGTTGTGITASIMSVGNGWYRCIATVGTALAGSNPCVVGVASADNTASYLGNGFSGVAIWGAQLEAGAFPTSYIPTVASQVTRAADVAVMTGTNFSSWYNQAAGTLYAEYAKYANVSSRIATISNNTGNNQIRLNGSVSTAIRPDWQIVDANVTQANVLAANTIAPNVFAKTAGAYAVNSFNQATNAVLGTEDTSGTVPSVSQMNIGANEGGAANLNGIIKKIAYYPLRVTDAQLQGLTS